MSARFKGLRHDVRSAYHKERIKRIQRQKEEAMAERTSTDEVIDILVETGRETIESARTWGRRLISSLADHTEIEKPRHLRVIPDLDHPSVTTGRFPGRFRPTVTVTADVTAKDFHEAEMILARDVSTALPSDYNVDTPKKYMKALVQEQIDALD